MDVYGYAMGIVLAVAMSSILYAVLTNGSAMIVHTDGDLTLWIEILLICGSIPFFAFEFLKKMINREK